MPLLLLLLAAIAVGLFSGCASSTKYAEQSGFLGDYSELRDGGKDEARYVYINPSADFAKYTKVKLAPVTVWRSETSQLNEVASAEIKELSDHLYSSVHAALSEDYQIVDSNGADVMLVRVAMTEAVGASQVMNSVSTIIPIGLVASAGKKLATGSHAFVGKAAVEMEILDSSTGERLAAAVDERAGSKGVESEWTQVKKTYDFWADKLQDRLRRLTRASKMKESFINVHI